MSGNNAALLELTTPLIRSLQFQIVPVTTSAASDIPIGSRRPLIANARKNDDFRAGTAFSTGDFVTRV